MSDRTGKEEWRLRHNLGIPYHRIDIRTCMIHQCCHSRKYRCFVAYLFPHRPLQGYVDPRKIRGPIHCNDSRTLQSNDIHMSIVHTHLGRSSRIRCLLVDRRCTIGPCIYTHQLPSDHHCSCSSSNHYPGSLSRLRSSSRRNHQQSVRHRCGSSHDTRSTPLRWCIP